MTIVDEVWFQMPDELYQRVQGILAGRQDELVNVAIQNPARFGKDLYSYWAGRKRNYSLQEVLALLEPKSIVEGASATGDAEEIKHTLNVEGLIWRWIGWVESDFTVPERFKEAFHERFPKAAGRWHEALNHDDRGNFGSLLKGCAIGIRGREDRGDDLGYETGDAENREFVLRKLDFLSDLWDEMWSEYYALCEAGRQVRHDIEFG